jgi:hypothetical protein
MARCAILIGLSFTLAIAACVTPIADPVPEVVMGGNGWHAPDAASFSWVYADGPYAHRHRLDFHKINPRGTQLKCQVAGGPWRGGDLSRLDAERLIAVVRKYDRRTAVLWVGGWEGIAAVNTACGGMIGGGYTYYFAKVQGAWILKRISLRIA